MIESWIIYACMTAAAAVFFCPDTEDKNQDSNKGLYGSYGPKPKRYCDPMKTVHLRKNHN